MIGDKALLDTVIRVVHLDSLVHGIAALQLSLPLVAPPSVHHTTAQELEEIPIVCEFSDVFPNDLLGMPSDRDVEFTIELQPGTTLISRRPYKMTPKDYWTKGTFIRILHLGVVRPCLSRRKINH
jgi:hypothetical protein